MEINKLELYFIDCFGRTILKKRLTGLPLMENYILSKSVEWFHDPEPCMIHRSAVMKRAYVEISEYLEELLKLGVREQSWANVPPNVRGRFDIDGEIAAIRIGADG